MQLGAPKDVGGLTAAFEANARLANMRFTRHDWDAYEYRYEFSIDVPEFNETRDVTVFWSPLRPLDPITHMPGQACRRHRNMDQYRSLCLWYPEDPPERRWSLDGGLQELRDLTVVHAFCEACCSRGEKWHKPEAPRPHRRPRGCRACPENWQSCP
jgi:hypothetical protein